MIRCDLCGSQHNVTPLKDEYRKDGVCDTCAKCTTELENAMMKYHGWWDEMKRRARRPFIWRVMDTMLGRRSASGTKGEGDGN